MSEIEPSTLLVRSPEPLTAAVGDEIVMLDATHGCYFGLDPSGSAIWTLLETPTSVEDLCSELVRRYDVSPDRCRSEVLFFLHELRDAGLIRAVGAG